jgi:hypothetical protein
VDGTPQSRSVGLSSESSLGPRPNVGGSQSPRLNQMPAQRRRVAGPALLRLLDPAYVGACFSLRTRTPRWTRRSTPEIATEFSTIAGAHPQGCAYIGQSNGENDPDSAQRRRAPVPIEVWQTPTDAGAPGVPPLRPLCFIPIPSVWYDAQDD